MRKALSSAGSRKRLNIDAVAQTVMTQRHKPALLPNLVHNTSGALHLAGENTPQNVFYSSASFNANELSSDQRVLQVAEDHIFTAVLKSKPTSRGGNYLRQHLYQEMLAQRRKHPGNLALALQNSIAELNKGFQSLHPFNLDVLQGIRLVIAFADFTAQQLHVASNGGCRCILGHSLGNDSVEIVADVGLRTEMEDNDVALISNTADLPLDNRIDVMILGSTGFWNEVAPFKAVLRADHFFHLSPDASNNSAAANLLNYSLHCVTQRMKAHPDRRMTSLNSVSNLVSLQAGNKGQYKHGNKQPVRRRRGDVHDDLTTVVTFFDWKGQLSDSVSKAKPPATLKASKWAVARMVFRFHIASANHDLNTWRKTVEGVRLHLQTGTAKNLLKQQKLVGFPDPRSSTDSSGSETSRFSS